MKPYHARQAGRDWQVWLGSDVVATFPGGAGEKRARDYADFLNARAPVEPPELARPPRCACFTFTIATPAESAAVHRTGHHPACPHRAPTPRPRLDPIASTTPARRNEHMRLTRIPTLALLALACLSLPADAGCGLFGRLGAAVLHPFQGRARASACSTQPGYAYTYQAVTTYQAVQPYAPAYAAPQAPGCANGYCPRPASVAPAAPLAPVAPQSSTDGPGHFLALLNAERARVGRPAVGWDASLAASASANYGVHSVRAPASSQCWAGCSSYAQAFGMWMNSPAHRAILMSATTCVGVSPCASGMTANCR